MSSGSIVPEGQRASDAPREPSPMAGRTSLGKYQILRELGAGGMGTVYLAVDTNLKRTVALKVLNKERTSNDTLVRRFESEAQAAAQLKHENIVTVYDAGQTDGYLFIALEFVDGTDIHELVAKRGAIPLKRSVGFIKQVTRALDHLHQHGIVHRDIKPSNLLLTKEGIVKLTDLGLARAVDESLQSNITREGTTVGTVDYMAPEQARNSQSADIRSDIYSLGCTWYQMLTGEPPFPEGSVTNKLYSHISKARPDPRAFNQAVPDEIVAVLHKMMARKADDRYQTPTELLNDLDNLGTGYKRLEEVLHGDGDGDESNTSPPTYATPAHGSPLPLPPRHPLRPAVYDSDSGNRAETERSIPEYRMPARQLPAPARDASPPPRQMPPPARQMPPSSRQGPGPSRQMPASSRQTLTPPGQIPTPTKAGTAGRQASRADDLPSKVGATNRKAPTRRGGVASNEPVMTPRDPNRPLGELIPSVPPSWLPLAKQIGAAVAAVVALGLLGWLTAPYWNPEKLPAGTERSRNPFDRSAADASQQVTTVNDDASKKSANGKAEANGNPKSQTSGKSAKPVVVADVKKPGSAARATSISARPAEREELPSWIDDLWDPHSTAAPKSPALPTITVGRVGKDPAQVSSLTDALARLPAEGGVIELRGPGPFLLPSQRISKRRQVIFTGISPHEGPTRAKNAAGEARPLIVIMPPLAQPAAAKGPSGIVANDTSLTFYGVDLVAFADAFRSNNPLTLIDVHSGDLTVEHCALTLIGTRTAPTIAFGISSAGPAPVDGRAPRLLLDRTVVRGSELGAIAADCQSLDFLAINSLLVTGQAPILTLTASSAFTPPSSRPAATANVNSGRMLRFFSCTGCSGQSAISLRANADSSEPPATEFLILNSTFGVSAQTQFPMVLLASWPVLPESSENSARFKKLSWKSQSFVARGWQDLVGSASRIGLPVRDAEKWGRFWGDPHSSIEYQSAPFPTIGDISAVAPAHFKSESLLLRDGAGDTSPPGCDVALLAVSTPDMVRRADAFSHRLPAVSELDEEVPGGPPVREIDLDNPKKSDLAKSINPADWPSGTRFLVHGTKKKTCSPIRVANRSLSLEFDKGLVLAFDDRRADPADDRNAFITVTGGSIEIVNATMRIESSTKAATHRLLDVRGGKFSIRNCNLLGPRHDYPGYEELIRFSSSQDESLPAGEGEAFTGLVRNSFLLSPRSLFTGDLSARNLVLSNSLLVSGGRLFNVRLPNGPSSSVLDLRSCTLSAGGEYFHFNTKSAEGASNPARVFVENSLFAPPVRRTDGGSSRAALIGSATGESFHERVDWWEYANAYSSLIQLPGSAGESKADSSVDSLEGWQHMTGPAHIVRSIGGTGAVLLPGDVSTIKEVEPDEFRLKPEALAATWSDTGKAVGAELDAQPTHRTKGRPTPKPVAPKKSVPQNQNTGSGI